MAETTETLALEAWLTNNGAVFHPNVRILQNNESGVHMRATAAILPATLLATAPHSISLSCLTAIADDAYPVFRTQNHRFRGEAIGFFYLMAQYINREQSFWKPYIDTLPQPDSYLTQPLFFDDEEDAAWLEGTDVWHTATARREIYEEYFHDGIEVLREAGVDTSLHTWRLFKWAISTYTSRAFSSRSLRPQSGTTWTAYESSTNEQGREAVPIDMSGASAEALHFPVLFPGLDAANHDHSAKVDWNFGPASFTVSLAQPSETDGVASGAEIYNNYGPKSNGELLIGYGFCLPNNPHDTVAMTLKPPPQVLQDSLRSSHPNYFTPTGDWNPQKSTFYLHLPQIPTQTRSGLAQRPQIFHQLPSPLLELLTYIIWHERGLTFHLIPNPTAYLTNGDEGQGRRYLPHIARMIVASLGPKVQKMRASRPTGDPGNKRQVFAEMYREGQIRIIDALVKAFKAYTRALIYRPPPSTGPEEPGSVPRGAALVSLPVLLDLISKHRVIDVDDFLQGIAAAAGSSSLPDLRGAGWEEDLWVLLLSYLLLEPEGLPGWLRGAFGEYIDIDAVGRDVRVDDDGGEADLQDAAEGVLDVVRAAAGACPGSRWESTRWTLQFVARSGGAVVRHESFLAMVPATLTGYGDAATDPNVEEEAGLFVYFHFPP